MFPEEILGLPPKRDIDFTIELILGATPVLKSPYRMSVLELTEHKMKLQQLLDKGYINPSVSPWGHLHCSQGKNMVHWDYALITDNLTG